MRYCGRFANVGKLEKISSFQIKSGKISSTEFYEWYRNQDRFEIAYDESEDFWYLRESCRND